MKKSKTQARCNRIPLFPKTTFQRSVADLGFFHNLSGLVLVLDQLGEACWQLRACLNVQHVPGPVRVADGMLHQGGF